MQLNQTPKLRWLTAQPIAHRGLHDAARGIIENTASAAAAAIAGRYGIEADLQVSADGEAMVHHDGALGRLTDGAGALAGLSAAALKQVAFKSTGDRMMTLGDLIDLVAGRTSLVLELKSRFDGDLRLAARTAAVLARHDAPVGVMSFDPAPIVELRRLAPRLARGIAAERYFRLPHWDFLPPARWHSSCMDGGAARVLSPTGWTISPPLRRRRPGICSGCRSSPGRCAASKTGRWRRASPTR
jgi:glycerophosphoryl diester phosphodiesterase